jgi:hypothetical protein
MTRTTLVAVVISLVTACSREPARTQPAARAPAPPALSSATPADLVAQIAEADRRGTWREVRQQWEGRRVRWTVTRHRALCQTADACHVAAFPVQRPAPVGWLPVLQLTASEMSALDARCGAGAACELTFEGTLRELVLSPELPTSVQFDDVRIVDVRAS